MRKRSLIGLGAGVAAAGAATFAYASLIERNLFTLRRFDVPVLEPDAEPLRILHLSDLHMMPDQRRKQGWVAALRGTDPDLVVVTGDNMASPEAVPGVLRALDPFLTLPGAFVFGSNDYRGPVWRNPLAYLLPEREYVQGADLHIGVTHTPASRVLNAMAADGFALLLAGHTHGGQVCVPGYGALTTNCDLPHAMAKGLHRWPGSEAWLHVSAGVGTHPTAPIRFACRPEATVLTLIPR